MVNLLAILDHLFGRSSPSPESLERAESLMARGDYALAWKLSRGAVRRARFATGPVAARLRANLGECAFQLGDPVRALALTQQALTMACGDGLRPAILGNLYEIQRYLGERLAAAETAEELARLSDDAEAGRYRRQAALLCQGEPLLRVVADVDGRRYELEEVLAGVAGPVRLVYERNRLTLRLAEKWTQEGQQAAQTGAFGEAMGLYDAAEVLDPHAPEPLYQAAFVRAYEEEWDHARELFDRVDQLAPGWFVCRSALALIRLGVGVEAFRLWHALAEGPLPHEAKRRLAEQAIVATPVEARAYFHHLHGKALQGLKRPEAERAFRLGLEHAAEPDLTTRLCVDLAAVVSSPQEKHRLLVRAVEIGGDLVAVATARIVLAFE